MEMSRGDKKFLQTRQRPSDPRGHTRVSLVDLFAGCGGLTLGVLEACRQLKYRLDIRLAVEANPRIANIYRANFEPAIWEGNAFVEDFFDSDIGHPSSPLEQQTKQRTGNVHILVGGPPCQGHSPLNNRTRGKDPKNELYLKMVRAAEILEPEHVIIENVPTILRDANSVVDRAVQGFQRLKYQIDQQVVSILDVGVPQMRKRHVLLASKHVVPRISAALSQATAARPRSVQWAIRDLLKREGSSEMDTASELSETNVERAEWLHQNDQYYLPNEWRPECHHEEHRYKSMYGRMHWKEPAQTITTGFGSPGQGRYLHPERIRTITPREAARLQFFPDWFDFSPADTRGALAEAIGNAVPSKLGFVLAAYVLKSYPPGGRKPQGARAKAGQLELWSGRG